MKTEKQDLDATPSPITPGVMGFIIGVLVDSGVMYALGFRRPDTSRDGRKVLEEITRLTNPNPLGKADPPLEPGADLPAFSVEGWLNGPPPSAENNNQQVLVVDIWASWCPECAEAAPNLVQTYEKYKDENVAFVSLTSDPKKSVEIYVEQANIPWPCAFRTSLNTIQALGAYHEGGSVPGYEVRPAIYVVGRDGRVRWCDHFMRYNHLSGEDIGRALEEQIDKALHETNENDVGPSTSDE